MTNEARAKATLRAAIVAYYKVPGNEAGGGCHVVLDDGNVDDDDLRFCIDECEADGDWLGVAIMRAMLALPVSERGPDALRPWDERDTSDPFDAGSCGFPDL